MLANAATLNVTGGLVIGGTFALTGTATLSVVGESKVNGTLSVADSSVLKLLGNLTIQGQATLSLSGSGGTSTLIVIQGTLVILGRVQYEARDALPAAPSSNKKRNVAALPLITSTTQVFGADSSLAIKVTQSSTPQSGTLSVLVAQFDNSVGTPALASAQVVSPQPECVLVTGQQLVQSASSLVRHLLASWIPLTASPTQSATVSVQNTCGSSRSGGLSAGAIAGIAVAAVVGGLAVAAVIFFVLYRRRRRADEMFKMQQARATREWTEDEMNRIRLNLASTQRPELLEVE